MSAVVDDVLYRARIAQDRMRVEVARRDKRIAELEQENDALREMAAHLARSAGGGAVL